MTIVVSSPVVSTRRITASRAWTTPTAFQVGLYLTGGEATKYMGDGVERGIESTRFALRTYKRLLYLVQEHQEKFLPEVTEALEAFEARLIERQETVEQTALKLFEGPDCAVAAHQSRHIPCDGVAAEIGRKRINPGLISQRN